MNYKGIEMKSLFSCIIIYLFISHAYCATWEVNMDSIKWGQKELLEGKTNFVIQYFPKAIASMESDNRQMFNDTIYTGLVNSLATAYQGIGDYRSADLTIESGLKTLENHGKGDLCNILNVNLGLSQYLLGNYNKAISHIKKAERYYHKDSLNNEYVSILNILASCYRANGDTTYAISTTERAIRIIEESSEMFSNLTKTQIYQNAGVVFSDYGNVEVGISFLQKAYNVAHGDSSCIGIFNRIAFNLGVFFLNEENYHLSNLYFNEIDSNNLDVLLTREYLNSRMLLSYFENIEEQAVLYGQKLNDHIKSNIISCFQNYSRQALENIWSQECIQLKVNMGLLWKFPDNQDLCRMFYDNALFYKKMSHTLSSTIRKRTVLSPNLYKLREKINETRHHLFNASVTDTAQIILLRDSLQKQENELIKASLSNCDLEDIAHSWIDVRNALKDREYAVEIITTSGFPSRIEEPELKIGALIIGHNSSAPKYVELCSNEQSYKTILISLKDQALGSNMLYSNNQEYTLYNLYWKNIEPLIEPHATVYIAPVLGTKDINWNWIYAPQGYYLNEKYNIHIVSSTASIIEQRSSNTFTSAVLFGGFDYGKQLAQETKGLQRSIITNEIDRGSFSQLNNTQYEIDSIRNILSLKGINTSAIQGDSAIEQKFWILDGDSPSILHVATHAYYLVGFPQFSNYFDNHTTYLTNDETLLRSGLLFNYANIALNNDIPEDSYDDGVITAEEISMMDFSNTEIVVLSACETTAGHTYEGYGGLIHAFKLAGAKSIIGCLWKVDDYVTSILMTEFYKNLMNGMDINQSLLKAQECIRQSYPDPYYWAGFTLIE